jgi:ribosomal protein L24E
VIPSLPLTTRFRRRLAAAMAVAVTAFLPLATPGAPTAQAADAKAAAAKGYWMVASDGGVFSFGDAKFFGSTGDIKLNQPIVGMAPSPTGAGYWFVATDGGIFSYGDAKFFGSTGAIKLNKPIVGMAATPSGKGYWLVASDGGIFAFGDAKFFGSTGALKLNKPIVGMTSSPTGNGYWFVASDGGVFAFGDAKFYGSTGALTLAKPITSMAATPSGNGYWFTASDGGIFAFGDAKFHGAGPDRPATTPRTVTAMYPTPDGGGYWLATATGELLAFGNAADLGGLKGALAKPIVGMTAVPANAVGVPGPNPTGPGPSTTGPTTGTTQPPYSGPMRFSSTALHSWGTPKDAAKSRISNTATSEAACANVDGVWENGQCRVYPYAEKVADIVEIGNRVYIGGSFKDLHKNDHNKTPTMSGLPMDYVAELDTDGNAVPGSAFNAKVSLDGPVRAIERSPDGKRLYVGGEFNKVNGENRGQLVALDPATGEIDRTFNPPVPNRYVSSITVHGSQIYIGGAFEQMGSTPRHGVAALNLDGTLNVQFVPPPRSQGRLYGQTANVQEDPPAEDLYGKVESLLVTRMGRYLLVGGTFLHFGYDHTADPKHLHAGLIALDPNTGALTTWQPSQSSSDSKRRPAFGMANYDGNPRDVGINGDELFFAATGGSGGRVIGWIAGGAKETPLWRGGTDGDAMDVAVTHDRVYLVGHFDHAVVDPNDPCLEYGPLPNGGNGVLCDQETPRRHLVAFDVRGEVDSTGKNTGKAILDPTFTAQANTSEGPYAIQLGANRMYVGGNFTEVASTPVGSGGQSIKQAGFAAYPPL